MGVLNSKIAQTETLQAENEALRHENEALKERIEWISNELINLVYSANVLNKAARLILAEITLYPEAGCPEPGYPEPGMEEAAVGS